jgi:hypothetical protein
MNGDGLIRIGFAGKQTAVAARQGAKRHFYIPR